MPVPLGVKFVLDDTNANIPTNWSEDTSYAGRYPLGAADGADGGTDGGQTQHRHLIVSHRHSFSASASSATVNVTLALGQKGLSSLTHVHGTAYSGYSGTQYSGYTSNDPPYYEVIFIEPDDALQDIPAGVVGFFDDAGELSGATGWSNYATLNDKWLKGVAAGGDAGGTGGSLDNHTHSSNHTHPTATSAQDPSKSQGALPGAPNASIAAARHTHDVTFGSSGANAGLADGLPPYRNLIPATSASDDLPANIIGLWDGAHDDIPAGWDRVTAQDDNFLRADSSVATGGSNQHGHTATSAHSGHSTGDSNASTTKQVDRSTPIVPAMTWSHSHPWTVGSTSANLSNNTSKENYPQYRTTIFIKYSGIVESTQTIQAKSRIQQTLEETIQSKARVQKTEALTIQAKSAIRKEDVAQVIEAKSAIEQSDVIKTTTAKARVQKTEEKTVDAKARIEVIDISRTIQGKSRIKKYGIINTSDAKARIKTFEDQSISAKARLKKFNIVNSISSKAHLWASREGFVQMRSYEQGCPKTLSEEDYGQMS